MDSFGQFFNLFLDIASARSRSTTLLGPLFSPPDMPPKFRPRADGPPSASLLSGADGPPISPGDALLDDNSIRSPGVPSPVDALVLEPGSVPDGLTFTIMHWLFASATANADDSTHALLDARDARGRAASQELLLESERLSVRASLRGCRGWYLG